jgi:hypothetical protein
MHHIQKNHGGKDEQRIKNVQVYLVVQKIPVIPLQILGQPEDGAHHDQEAGNVEDMEMFAPGDVGRTGARDWEALEFPVKVRRDNYEEPKEENLNKQADHNDPLAGLVAIHVAAALNATTCHKSKISYMGGDGEEESQESARRLNIPAPCNRKERTSPVTKTLVNHFF